MSLNVLRPPCTNKGVGMADSVHFNDRRSFVRCIIIHITKTVYYLVFTHFLKYCNNPRPLSISRHTCDHFPDTSLMEIDALIDKKINIWSTLGLIKVLICFSNSIPMTFFSRSQCYRLVQFCSFYFKSFFINNKYCLKYNFAHVRTHYDMRTYTYGDHFNS